MTVEANNMFDLDTQLAEITKEMEDTEDELATLGFPVQQWMLIKKYIGLATLHSQTLMMKGLSGENLDVSQDLPPAD